MKPKSSIAKLALSFVIPFIALLILIPRFFNVELNNEIIPALAVGALFISLIIVVLTTVVQPLNSLFMKHLVK